MDKKENIKAFAQYKYCFEISQEEEEKAVLLDMKGWTKALLMKMKTKSTCIDY